MTGLNSKNDRSDAAHLMPRHRCDLEKSGLNDDTIALAGLHSTSDAKRIARALNWTSDAKLFGACLAIPYFDAAGRRIDGYVRFKPDNPRKAKDKKAGKVKPVKYESPRGQSNRAYFPPLPAFHAAVAAPNAALLITEGEKKALKATQEGFPCIGLVGVEGWSKRRKKDADGRANGPRELLDELAELSWQGRPVFVVFDSDTESKPAVKQAEAALAAALQDRGAIVRIVRLPSAPDLVKE